LAWMKDNALKVLYQYLTPFCFLYALRDGWIKLHHSG
jgi:hypothetical protein